MTLVAIPVALVAIFVTFVAISVSLELIADALVAMSVSVELIFEVLVLILDSTSDKLPKVKVPSMSASLSIVTVPEVCPRDRSPVEKSPYKRFRSVNTNLPFSSVAAKPFSSTRAVFEEI